MAGERGRRDWRRTPPAWVLAGAVFLCAEARAEAPIPPKRPSHNLFGMTGAIDTPSAEMQPDAQLTATVSHFGGFTRNTVSFQIFPFLEGAFRYSVLDDVFRGTTQPRVARYDRSFDLKLRLVEEGDLWPAIAVGLQDFLGTGIYSGEYVAATKRFLGGDLAVTGGIGWGRFATAENFNNPLGWYADGFRTRDAPDPLGGDVNFGSFFQGDAGVFGSLSWRTPLDGLTLKLEYSNDDYAQEEENAGFDQNMPVNFGVEYRPVDWAEIGAYYMYGESFGVRLTISGNLFDPIAAAEDVPAPSPLPERPVDAAARARADAALGEVASLVEGAEVTTFFADAPVAEIAVETGEGGVRWGRARLAPAADDACPLAEAAAIDAEAGLLDALTFESADGAALCTLALRPAGERAIARARRAHLAYPTGWAEEPETRAALRAALAQELEAQALRLVALELEPRAARLHLENPTYNQMPRAIGRAARAMARRLPASVETFEIVPVEAGLPVVAVSLSRTVLEEQVNRPDAARKTWSTARIADAAPLSGAAFDQALDRTPRISWAIEPQIPVSLFDPDEPVRADLQIAVTGGVELAPGLSLTGTVSKRVVGNLDGITRTSDSELPRVRSDFARYLDEGDPAITRLSADYVTKLAPEIYGRVSGGLLERMFAGIQGELLWKPATQSWGLGAELAYVRQRDFDTLFDLRDYDTVTGHVSLYWDTPFRGVSMQLDAGRYLAGDWGGTVGLKRRFANGWEIGGFATFTDVSFDEFGEGSFDKGLFLTIPLNWSLPYESRSRIASVIRPLSRDGGQRLDIANRLYPRVEDADAGGLARRSGGFWE